MADNNTANSQRKTGWGGLIIRFVIAAVVLMITAFFTPGYTITNFWTALLQALAIVGLDYIIQMMTGMNASPWGRGLSGFLITAAIIYLTQYIIPGVTVSMIGAVIAALIIGIIEAILPINVI
ncbi:membrane protein of unknown function [Oxobacter pfennigii]|uniref:Phage holin family protein n=1 Tax=Oxobacter pfennigii TaxID=36849 RepID=A0A0P9AFQ5_9CLOT|nr:phage holin family protein [Oxobacter pfennigii]KPU44193.1 membrane protein of unknown function [Oxobacter pfennigii]